MSSILMDMNEVSDKEAAWLAGTLFGAGSTTVSQWGTCAFFKSL